MRSAWIPVLTPFTPMSCDPSYQTAWTTATIRAEPRRQARDVFRPPSPDRGGCPAIDLGEHGVETPQAPEASCNATSAIGRSVPPSSRLARAGSRHKSSLNAEPRCIKVVDTFRPERTRPPPLRGISRSTRSWRFITAPGSIPVLARQCRRSPANLRNSARNCDLNHTVKRMPVLLIPPRGRWSGPEAAQQ